MPLSVFGFVEGFDAFSRRGKEVVETININCTLLLALINDILTSRIESGTMDFLVRSIQPGVYHAGGP